MEKIKEFLRNNYIWLIVFITLVIFLFITEEIFSKEILVLDVLGYKVVSKLLISEFMTPIAKFITNFGGVIWIISFSVALLILSKNKKVWLSIVGNLAIAGGLNLLLKNIVQRPRPTEFRIINESRL